MKRLLVTGSRTWQDEQKVRYELSRAYWDLIDGGYRGYPEDVLLVHGGARGVDTIAAQYWLQAGMPEEVHIPQWRSHGVYNRMAGHQRNQRMVDAGVDMCLAFIHNHSAGATDCARRVAEAAIHDENIHLRIFRS